MSLTVGVDSQRQTHIIDVTRQGDHSQPPSFSASQQLSLLVAGNPGCETRGQWVLHVPDQHKPYDQPDKAPRSCW